MKKKIKLVCDKCGKEPNFDKDKSNKNWKVYTTSKCKCGGEFIMILK